MGRNICVYSSSSKSLDKKYYDFATQYFYNVKNRIACPVSIVISKDDMFTKNYKKAEKMWNPYVETVDTVHFIDSTTHYFQSEHSKELVHILLTIIEN